MCLEWGPDKWVKIKSDDEFRYLMVKIVINQWRSKSSPFWKKYRSEPYEDSKHIEDILDEPYEEEAREILTRKLIDQLYPSDKNIVKDYYETGLTIMEITKKWSVEKNFVSNTLARVRGSLERRIVWHEKGHDEIEVMETILPLIGKKRIAIDARQYVIDVWNHLSGGEMNCIHDPECVKKILEKVVKKMKL